ncbi:MAG: hypothetical protein V3T07_08860 [Myxococcota bacterium]
MQLETALNGLPLLLTGASVLICGWLSYRSFPWAVSRLLKGWDGRLDYMEAEWNRTRGDLAVQLEQLEQLDESVKKHRAKTTQERVRLDQRTPEGPTPLSDLRRRANLI